MARLMQKFLIRCRRNGWSLSLMALALVGLVGVSAVISGAQGVMFSLALGCAFLLGTANRPGPFHLRSLLTQPLDHPVNRDVLCARIAHYADTPENAGHSLCIVLAIDGFEDLTSRLGQRGIDDLNRQLGERLFREIRNSDTLASLGDGRFAVFLPPNTRINLESAVQTAMRLHGASARPVTIDGLRLFLTSCAGLCTSQRLPNTFRAPDLLSAAEMALATARRDGPRTIRAFDQAMIRKSNGKSLKTGKRGVAKALDNNEIGPWFQPQICTDTGALTGIEALARWVHPDEGILLPGDFLPEIQVRGLSTTLTETMMTRALGHLCAWDQAGVHIPRVSVNLGAEDLADPRLVERITWALDRHGLPPTRFGVEVLESVAAGADPDDMAARNLLALGRLGCHIDLDDFGTGSASINGIRRFSIDRIKIDRSLVTAVDTDPDQHAMVSAILTMAAQLKVEVLGEGVETPGEHSALAQLGCDHVQGYAIARPMPAADLITWILRRRVKQPPDPDTCQSLRPSAPQTGQNGKTA